MPRVHGAGGHRRPPPQRQLLRRALPAPLPRPGARRRSTTSTCSRRASGCSSRCRAARTRSRLWDILLDARLRGRRPYLGLGHRRLLRRVRRATRAPSPTIGALTLLEVDLPDDYGFDIPTGAKAARRVPCSACGLSKRHLFDEAALDGGYDVVATGHNLDDEAAVLFGNVLRWQTDYLGRQLPGAARRGRASRARSSRSCGSASARWPRTACCAASTTSSRSARWPRATSTSATRRRSTPSRRTLAGHASTPSTSASSSGRRDRFAPRRRRRGRAELGAVRARAARRPPARSARSAALVERAGPPVPGRARTRRGAP